MKRLVPLKPAPRPRTVECACGRDEAIPHNCEYRRAHRAKSASSQGSVPSSALTRLSPVDDGREAKRLRLTMGMPSARRRSKGALTPVSPHRQTQLKGFPVDVFHAEPFNAYPIATIGVVHRMTEHYIRVWAPQQGKPFAFEGHPNPYLSLVFPYALQNAVLFEGLIAMCRASWLLHNGEDYHYDRAFAYHHSNTKYSLQKRLESPDTCADDATLLTVAALATIDYTLGDHSMAEQYLQSMRRMVQLRGGMKNNTPWEILLNIVVKAFEGLWVFVLSSAQPAIESAPPVTTPLRNEIPVYANHPFTPEFTLALSKIPEHLSNLAVKNILSVQIVRIIGTIPRTSSSQFNSTPTPASATYPPISLPLEARHSTALQAAISDLLRLSTLSTTKMENLFVQGLVAYCLPLQYGSTLNPGDGAVVRILQQCMDNYMRHSLSEEAAQLDREAVVWVSVVLASTVGMVSGDRRDIAVGGPVLERILGLYPETRRWERVEKILKKFLWHEELAASWKNCWEAVMGRRRSPGSGSEESQTPSPRLGRSGPVDTNTAGASAEVRAETVRPPSRRQLQPQPQPQPQVQAQTKPRTAIRITDILQHD